MYEFEEKNIQRYISDCMLQQNECSRGRLLRRKNPKVTAMRTKKKQADNYQTTS